LLSLVKIGDPAYNLRMKIGRFAFGEKEFTGMVKEGSIVVELPDVSLSSAVYDGSLFFKDSMPHIEEGDQYQIKDLRFLPLWHPRKILCLGLNYRGHIKEGDWVPPDEPVYFEKSSSCAIPHHASILLPPDIGRVDPEVELAAVIGSRAYNLDSIEAENVILGWTILNDVTARGLQRRDQAKKYPWFRSKSMDTFCPFGPWLVTIDELPSVRDLAIESRINGRVCQSSTTSEMIFSGSEVIAYISKTLTLEPGDIVSLGTPEGISPIVSGDFVECEIRGIGILANQVI